MSHEVTLEGGCHCGSLRYRTHAMPMETAYCHCRDCQQTTGAPVLAWAAFSSEHFEYITGSPAIYRSSAAAQREFCVRCGAQIAFRQDAPADTVDVNVGTLDDPGVARPDHHIWTASRIPWFETTDDLPRFEGEAPEPASS